MLKIRVKTEGEAPKKLGDWIDLQTAEDVTLAAMEFKVISLGVCMELPKGYEAHIAPRSSTYKKWGVIQANSVGIVDSDYNGDNDVWGYPVIALRDTFIPRGTRIAQFRLYKVCEPVEFEVVETLGNADRGGFGSTGS